MKSFEVGITQNGVPLVWVTFVRPLPPFLGLLSSTLTSDACLQFSKVLDILGTSEDSAVFLSPLYLLWFWTQITPSLLGTQFIWYPATTFLASKHAQVSLPHQT